MPELEQWSARALSHDTQAAPFTPQAVELGVEQVLPLQHPVAQLAALHPLHAPPLQV